jgi:hypothetical protein
VPDVNSDEAGRRARRGKVDAQAPRGTFNARTRRGKGRQGCIRDETLEELAVCMAHAAWAGPRRAPEQVDVAGMPPEIETHVRRCAGCRERLERLERETAFLIGLLLQSESVGQCNGEASQDQCATEEELALYLDKVLKPAERKRIEVHLASCRPCQSLLVILYKSVKRLLNS